MAPATPDSSGTMTSIRAEHSGTAASSSEAKPATMVSYDDGHNDGVVSESGDEGQGGVSLRGIEVLSLGDDHAVEVTTKSTGRYSINVAKHESSKGNGFTPGGSKRYTPPFVRNNFMGRRDDPFASTPSKAKRTSGGSFKSAEKESLMSRDWRSGSGRSGSSSNGSNHGTLLTYGGRAISGSNAQAYYPPAYCIFVANLLATASDEVLTASVTDIFRKYGHVFVKVRRDSKGMPYSFAQFTCQEDADEAMIHGNGKAINGRPCRIEPTKANRLYYIAKKHGSVLEASEAKELLGNYGKVKTWNTSLLEQQYQNLGPGVLAYFDLFESGRMACQNFSNHPNYVMHLVAPQKSPKTASITKADADSHTFLERYEVDRRSIFVGNLPMGVSEYDVAALFDQFGRILNVHLMAQPSKHPEGGQYTFAFVEFTNLDSAQRAAVQMAHYSYMGKILRVAAKDSSHGRKNGLASAPSSLIRHRTTVDKFQSPAPRRRSEQEVMPSIVPSPVYQVAPQHQAPAPAAPPVAYSYHPYDWNPFYGYHPSVPYATYGYGYTPQVSATYSAGVCTPSYTPGVPSAAPYMSASPGYSAPPAGAFQTAHYEPQYQLPTPPQWVPNPPQVAASQPESGELAPVQGQGEDVEHQAGESQ